MRKFLWVWYCIGQFVVSLAAEISCQLLSMMVLYCINQFAVSLTSEISCQHLSMMVYCIGHFAGSADILSAFVNDAVVLYRSVCYQPDSRDTLSALVNDGVVLYRSVCCQPGIGNIMSAFVNDGVLYRYLCWQWRYPVSFCQ